MDYILDMLLKEKQYLDKIIGKTEKSLAKAPEGSLRVSCSQKTVQYYIRRDSRDTNGVYIKKKDMDIAKALAQKDYDLRLLAAAKSRRDKIRACIDRLSSQGLQEVYENLSQPRQELVTPLILPEDDFVKQWSGQKYQRKAFLENDPEIFTERGERVRSKSEKIIADKFFLMGIPYRYEYPVHLKGFGTVFTDFAVLNKASRKEYYLEHLGLMDHADYCEKAIRKLEAYERNGIFQGEKLLLTYETRQHPLNIKTLENLIDKFLI